MSTASSEIEHGLISSVMILYLGIQIITKQQIHQGLWLKATEVDAG